MIRGHLLIHVVSHVCADGGDKVTPCDISDLGLINAATLREGGPVRCQPRQPRQASWSRGRGAGRAYPAHWLPEVVALGVPVSMGVSAGCSGGRPLPPGSC